MGSEGRPERIGRQVQATSGGLLAGFGGGGCGGVGIGEGVEWVFSGISAQPRGWTLSFPIMPLIV